MALGRENYADRPQALVKHTFLNEYLPRLVNKIVHSRDTFVYVDGFAGPWQSADEEFSDTSFGIALNAMASAKLFQKKRNRSVRMMAFLVEKNAAAFARLETLKDKFPTIEIVPYHGEFQVRLPEILAAIPQSAFCFSLIDPKGFKLDLNLLKPLLSRQSSEVLINFMFDFINRFVQHPDSDIVETINALIPGANWRDLLKLANAGSGGTPEYRESILIDAFKTAVAEAGDFEHVASLTVQKPLVNRTLYHLVFGTRSAEGLLVFRDSQNKALHIQATVRSTGKARAKADKTGQGEMFGGIDAVQSDPSSLQIEEGLQMGSELALQLIRSHPDGVEWSKVWPIVLARHTVTRSSLGKAINARRKSGEILAPNWPSERTQIPPESQVLMVQWS